MKQLFIVLSLLISTTSFAQQEDVKTLYEAAKNYQRQGDYQNAVLVLNRALQQDNNNQDVIKELAFVQYLQRDYNKAINTIKPLIDRKDTEVPAFQVAAMIYKARDEAGEAEKLYKKALKKFPNSGALYSEYGELLWGRQDYSAIKQWEKGIEEDPNYAGNYYNAARYYYFTMDKAWSLIYGEIFVNMESYTRRTVEIKNILANGYKKLFTDQDIMKNQDSKNDFTVAYLTNMSRQSSLASMGITPESLTMIRTRFLLDWDEKYAGKFPFRLFEYHRQLLKEGLFEAYNQWLFGSVQNLTAFQTWINTHPDSYQQFTSFQQGRVFKMNGPVYQSK
jgi:Tfp pilus assembly protein PilF